MFLDITDFYVAFAVGMAISLLLEELFGISAGGIIVPGYMGLLFNQPLLAFFSYVIAFITFLIINYVMPHFVILYGKRKFVATLMVALILKLILDRFYPLIPFVSLEYRGMGIVVPGLLASTFAKQGIKITLPVSLLAAFAVYLIVHIVYIF